MSKKITQEETLFSKEELNKLKFDKFEEEIKENDVIIKSFKYNYLPTKQDITQFNNKIEQEELSDLITEKDEENLVLKLLKSVDQYAKKYNKIQTKTKQYDAIAMYKTINNRNSREALEPEYRRIHLIGEFKKLWKLDDFDVSQYNLLEKYALKLQSL